MSSGSTARDYLERPLLAKSLPVAVSEVDAHRSATLVGHLADVREVARAVLATVGERIVGDLDLEPVPWLDRLRRSLLLGATLHDLGKANDRFQAMLRGDRERGQQPIRHEAISAFMALRSDLLRPWLFPNSGPAGHLAEAIAVLASLGHHIKYYPRFGQPPGVAVPGAAGPIRLLCDHADFVDCMELITGERRSLPGLSMMPTDLISTGAKGEGLGVLLMDLEDEVARALGYSLSEPYACLGSPWGRLLAVTKALLVACDVAGSAVSRHQRGPGTWSARMLSETIQAVDLGKLIQLRLQKQNVAPPRDRHWSGCLRPFQAKIAASTSRITVAVAGCGSGKTIAAYAWAERNAPGRKLFLCYPTTGTATEGFSDYVLDTSIPGELVHSRAMIDLQLLLANTDRPGLETDEEEEIGLRIAGLEPWGARIVVCTADTVLGLMQNHRRGLFSSAAILGSALVFDEVHAYDSSMWNTLIRLLQWLPGARAVLITATLPAARRTRLVETFGDQVTFVSGPVGLESLPRYRVERERSGQGILQRVTDAVRAGNRVLWVSNTVDRTVRRARRVATALGVEPGRPPAFVYHSRFRYEDRVDRHREVVDRFKKAEETQEGLVACTTQVAEMSLDLDAELLVTDLAPIPAVIQRMGRLNRRVTTVENCTPMPAIVLDVEHPLPYEESVVEATRSWLERLPDPSSQRDLAAAFTAEQEECDQMSGSPPQRPALLEPVLAGPGQLRESGYTVSFLLPEDATRARSDPKHAIRAALPMIPGRRPFRDWERIGPAFVLPEDAIDYDPYLGARWSVDGVKPW